jgi:hypothetical protein
MRKECLWGQSMFLFCSNPSWDKCVFSETHAANFLDAYGKQVSRHVKC